MKFFWILMHICFNLLFFVQLFSYAKNISKFNRHAKKYKVLLNSCLLLSILGYSFYVLIFLNEPSKQDSYSILIFSNAALFSVKAVLDKYTTSIEPR